MLDKIQSVKISFDAALNNVKDLQSLEELRLKFLVKKGDITQLLDQLKDVPPSEKPLIGKELNTLRKHAETTYNSLKEQYSANSSLPRIDISLTGRHSFYGTLHPVRQIFKEMVNIFDFMGFEVAEGPQIEDE